MNVQREQQIIDTGQNDLTHAHALYVYTEGKEIIKEGGVEETIKKDHGGFEIPLLLATPEFLEAWKEWVEYRTEAGRKYHWVTTDRCFRKSLQKCEQWGVRRSIAAIDHSIEYGYRGLFEPHHSQQPEPDVYKPGSSFRGRGE